MQTIEACFEIVTPMFIGGGNDDVDLRPPSIKGALRFWWRALHWGQCLKGRTPQAALTELHRQEAELFGAAAKDEKYGQRAFLLNVKTEKLKILSPQQLDLDKTYNLKEHPWHSYLLGLGLMEYENHANHYLRSAIVSGSFTVKILCKKAEFLNELQDLLLIFGLLGGLGSRSRKGFGSVSITQLKVGNDIIAIPENREQVINNLTRLINKDATNMPYTAFTANSKILCSTESSKTAWNYLGDIAEKMQMFRGWGFNNGNGHRINRIVVNHDCHTYKRTDHQIIYDYADNRILNKRLPNSISFGLPRSYALSTIPRKEFRLNATGDKRSRRASPLFIHVHQFPNKQTMIIQSFLPATFLPTTDQVEIQQKVGKKWNSVACVTPVNNWDVINEYLALFNTWQEV